MNNYEYLMSNLTIIEGIGIKTSKLFKKKNIHTIFDLLLTLPKSTVDRTNESKVKDLRIGMIQTLSVKVVKYNFPRLRNLPNKVICKDETGELECVFFNSYEGYIKKILPLNSFVNISGKINIYKNKYQITNPKYISTDKTKIKKIHSKYGLTDGLNEKKYNQILVKVLKNLPDL